MNEDKEGLRVTPLAEYKTEIRRPPKGITRYQNPFFNGQEKTGMAAMSTLALTREFLSHKRIAMVGVSRDPKHFSRKLYGELSRRGYEVVPVNPNVHAIDGKPCYPKVAAIDTPPKCALLMTPQESTPQSVQECASAGIELVWIYGISGPRKMSPQTLQVCNQKKLRVIPGYCPYMFLGDTAFFHRLHALAWKTIGRYPK